MLGEAELAALTAMIESARSSGSKCCTNCGHTMTEQWAFSRQSTCTFLDFSPTKYDNLVKAGILRPFLPHGFKRGSYLTRADLDAYLALSRQPIAEPEPEPWTPDRIVPLVPVA